MMYANNLCLAEQFAAMRQFFAFYLTFGLITTRLVSTTRISSTLESSNVVPKSPVVTNDCFPALGFKMPKQTPRDSELQHWWCDPATEYAFVGFSYEVTACKLVHIQARILFFDETHTLINRSKCWTADGRIQRHQRTLQFAICSFVRCLWSWRVLVGQTIFFESFIYWL